MPKIHSKITRHEKKEENMICTINNKKKIIIDSELTPMLKLEEDIKTLTVAVF